MFPNRQIRVSDNSKIRVQMSLKMTINTNIIWKLLLNKLIVNLGELDPKFSNGDERDISHILTDNTQTV